MPQKFEKPFWRTVDGKEFSTLKDAEAHERANYHHALTRLEAPAIRAAIELDPDYAPLALAIERAANEIKRNRRAKAETPAAPPAMDP